MGKLDKDGGAKQGLSRRDFLKSGAAAAAVGATGLELAAPAIAAAATLPVTETYHTTCPYCSASCGQLVDVNVTGGVETVLDIYGDHMSPFNDGGLCAKGAGTYQLVTNSRRIGAFEGTHPVNSVFAAKPDATAFPAKPTGYTGPNYTGSEHTYAEGVAYWRLGNGNWFPVPLDIAMQDIATKMVTARGNVTAANGYNSKGVAFFGTSHLNNEQNYTYRRLIAQFGSSNVEHQARI
jgi:formate dehydrogenase major subunit